MTMNTDKSRIKGRFAPSWGVTQWHQLPAGASKLDVRDYRNRVLVLYFFEAWDPVAHRTGFPMLQQLQQIFGNDDRVGIVAIQTSTEANEFNTVQAAIDCSTKYALNIPVGHSGNSSKPSTLHRKYGASTLPWAVIVDRQGIIRHCGYHVRTMTAIQAINYLNAEEAKPRVEKRVRRRSSSQKTNRKISNSRPSQTQKPKVPAPKSLFGSRWLPVNLRI